MPYASETASPARPSISPVRSWPEGGRMAKKPTKKPAKKKPAAKRAKPTPAAEPEPIPDEALKRIAFDLFCGKIFTDHQISRIQYPYLLHMIFLPIAFMTEEMVSQYV